MNGISIVIRTKDSSATLPMVLSRLRRVEGDELIVVDSGSTDDTVRIAERAGARIVHMAAGEFTYGRSLNRGFSVARNDWILSLSSHCIPGPDDLLGIYRRAITRFPEDLAAAAGPMLYSDLDAAMGAGVTAFHGDEFSGGFGIGAYEARALAMAMGGTLSVESRVGSGSRFTLDLPPVQRAAQSAERAA